MIGYIIALCILLLLIIPSGGTKGRCHIKPPPTTPRPKFTPSPQKPLERR